MKFIQNLFNWLFARYTVAYWGLDISFWNDMSDEQLQDMVNHGLAFLWIAMINGVGEDRLFRKHVAQARRLKIPFGVYIWLVPNMDPIQQADAALALLRAAAPDAKNYMIDYEQTDFNQLGGGGKIPAATIYSTFAQYVPYVSARLGSMPIVIYSSYNYLYYVCPALAPFTSKYFLILASYETNTGFVVDWTGFKKYLGSVRPPSIPKNVKNGDVDGHQFTSVLQIQNDRGVVYERLDFDSIQDKVVFATLFGAVGPVIEPVIVPPEANILTVCNCWALSRRPRPDMGAAAVGYLKPGDKVTVKSFVEGWAFIHTEGSKASLFYPFVSTAGDGWVGKYYLK